MKKAKCKHKWERQKYMRFEKGDAWYRYCYKCKLCKREKWLKRDYE